MRKQFLFLILSAAGFVGATGCGPNIHDLNINSENNAIFGGQEVSSEDFAKHVVAIHNRDMGYWCTGTLIANDTILTAAHCINSGRPSSYNIYFSHSPGNFDRSSHDIAEMKFNTPYDASAYEDRHDVGVIRFKGDLPAGFEPIQLPTSSDLAAMGKSYIAIGYGSLTARKGLATQGSGTLRYTPMTLSSPVSTQKSQFVVDQTNGHGICFGDSGGPALVKVNGHHTIFGIASAVYTLDKNAKARPDFDVCRYNAIYTSVFYYLDWIKKASAEIH